MTYRASILLAAALPLTACQTSSEMNDVDRQALVLAAVPSNYRQVLPASVRAVLPDPSGIRTAEISTPFLGAANAGTESPLVCVRLQYAGGADGQSPDRTIAFVFDDGMVVGSQWDSAACAGATYSLFPELRTAYPDFGAQRG